MINVIIFILLLKLLLGTNKARLKNLRTLTVLQPCLIYQIVKVIITVFYHRQLQEEQSPYSLMNHYLNMYENKNGIYSNKERYEAYDLLQSQYYPVIKIYKEKILKLKKEIDIIVISIQNNKKKYYYFYSKFKNLV